MQPCASLRDEQHGSAADTLCRNVEQRAELTALVVPTVRRNRQEAIALGWALA
ncbi:hypothetical protein [Deinococcus sp. QL22]|uniref:hypothetical protein n=1 Tax=Deinococcus sp. QL22 TaxID=2939437 RepID=UPI002017C367|nr:hypothetical protein [Deinococcus sp. QL22]UQN08157.1 hypothetical protein M1R55_18915 [Deinococcus sp. QL22]